MPRKLEVFHWGSAGWECDPGETAFKISGLGDTIAEANEVARFLTKCLNNRDLIEAAITRGGKKRGGCLRINL